ncbi:hypothetical protein QAD02_022045 [Eretmocerus hayati]|uniref:Uncharacterized protein n=1 Tax=Eretmocerus hayati TaxID=131215 RepID=A0ACC2PTI7_9HYME|nr:hypothetical protein QAD02_022045 [Eretmocerus hayati]
MGSNGKSHDDSVPPKYFSMFLEKFDERMTEVNSSIERLDVNISERIGRVENQLVDVRHDLGQVVQKSILVDKAEVLITGLPKQPDVPNVNILNSLFNFLKVPRLLNFIFDMRVWTGPDMSNTRKIPTGRTDTQSSSSSGITSLDSQLFSMVVKFLSPTVRDEFIFRCSKLKDKWIQHIFNVNGTSQVFCENLWPPEVYRFFKKTYNISRNLNYERPVVKNLVVCVRETRESALIPINSEKDLELLKP